MIYFATYTLDGDGHGEHLKVHRCPEKFLISWQHGDMDDILVFSTGKHGTKTFVVNNRFISYSLEHIRQVTGIPCEHGCWSSEHMDNFYNERYAENISKWYKNEK